MRVVLISDTHGAHRRVTLPPGDILIHAGDMTNVGELAQFCDFNEWVGEQPFKHKNVLDYRKGVMYNVKSMEVKQMTIYEGFILAATAGKLPFQRKR